MKRLIPMMVAFLLILSISSCCPCRHLATSSRDSVRIEVHTRIEKVRDTIYWDIPAQSERITVRDTSSYLENAYAFSDARINADGSLFHSLATKPQQVPVEFEKPIVFRDSIVYRDREATHIVQLPHELTPWQRFRLNGFWVLLAALVILLRKQITAVVKWII